VILERAPRANSRGVLAAQSDLLLPTFASPQVRPPAAIESSGIAAKPVRPEAPPGWESSAVSDMDLVFGIDNTGSMYGRYGDPRCVRRAAALSVVNLMARARGARVGVVHWGSVAPEELTLPLTDTRRRRRIESALAIPPSLGANNFPAALARSREVLEASDPTRIRLVLVITDGIEAVGPDAAAQLKRLEPGSVHVLLVDHSHGCVPAIEAAWAALPLGSFTRLELLDTTVMAGQAADIVARAAGIEMPHAPTSMSPTSRRRTP
jgi:hypothetical protein